MVKVYFYRCPLGVLKICAEAEKIISCERVLEGGPSESSPVLMQCIKQLDEYFAGQRAVFDLPLLLSGTPFQKKVWRALQKIPYGQTRTYKEMALKIGHTRAFRAVGNANNKNKLPIIIPCHRVVAVDAKHGGFGMGMDKKRYLLDLERSSPPPL